MIIAPLRVMKLALASLGNFSVRGEGNGIIAPLTGSPTLIADAPEPAEVAGLM
jgi:hypothetical protein